MRREIYNCDICGMERQEANHWFTASLFDSPAIQIAPWNDKRHGDYQLCGAECCHKLLGKFLDGEFNTGKEAANV